MCFKFVLYGLLINIYFQDTADCIPVHLIENEIAEGFLTNVNTLQIQGRKEEINTSTVKSFLLNTPLEIDYASEKSITTTVSKTNSEENVGAPYNQIFAIQLRKRDISENDLVKDEANVEESIDKNVNKEARASSIPFLPKQESEGQSGSGGGLIPGLPSMPGLPDSSNTPMAVIGGFQMVLMPMPGLTMSNIGSAMQAGQQFSQMVPGMPSIPG